MSRTPGFFLLASLVLPLSACDNEPSKVQTTAKSASPTGVSSSPPPPPPAPKALIVTVDDSAAMFDGDRVDFTSPDVKGRLATGVSGKKVAGESVTIVAARETKMPKIAQVIAAVASAKPKAIVVKTMKRDRTTVDLPIALDAKREGCAAVGYVARDSSSSSWPASGATATKYSKGMAGPDITRASDGMRKLVGACDATHIFVGADEGVTWGLAADLAIAVLDPEDGGASASKVKQIAVVAKATPGRKLEDD
jgi:hypothetical protein